MSNSVTPAISRPLARAFRSNIASTKAALKRVRMAIVGAYHRYAFSRLRHGELRDVWFTYDAANFTDGAGAQFHRILGIYALSRAAGAGYVHTPIRRLDYKGLPIDGRLTEAETIEYFERLTLLPSKTELPSASDLHVVELEHLSVAALLQVPRPALIKLVFPHSIMDSCPRFWGELTPILKTPNRNQSRRVALHVRRGELHHYDQNRMLPNSYYIAIAKKLSRLLAGEELTFELFSEAMPLGSVIPRGEFFPGALDRDVRVDADHDRFSEFDALPNLVKHINTKLSDTVDRLVTADILVMSRSSLSMVAALLNPNRLILYHPFWHASAPGWLTTTPDGDFDSVKAAEILRRYAEVL